MRRVTRGLPKKVRESPACLAMGPGQQSEGASSLATHDADRELLMHVAHANWPYLACNVCCASIPADTEAKSRRFVPLGRTSMYVCI